MYQMPSVSAPLCIFFSFFHVFSTCFPRLFGVQCRACSEGHRLHHHVPRPVMQRCGVLCTRRQRCARAAGPHRGRVGRVGRMCSVGWMVWLVPCLPPLPRRWAPSTSAARCRSLMQRLLFPFSGILPVCLAPNRSPQPSWQGCSGSPLMLCVHLIHGMGRTACLSFLLHLRRVISHSNFLRKVLLLCFAFFQSSFALLTFVNIHPLWTTLRPKGWPRAREAQIVKN